MAGKANFSVIKGDTFTRSVTFRNKTSGVPVNLTGATVSGKIRKGTDIALTCSLVNAVAGSFTFGLSAAQTGDLAAGTYIIEVQITFADSTVKTLFNGNFVVLEQVA